jgi:hypothetical protein
MSFHKQIERQLAQDFSPNEETILVDYQDAVFHGRRLQAWEMGRLFMLAGRAVMSALKHLIKPRRPIVANLDDHLRQDIGLTSAGLTKDRGYL